MSPTQAGAPDGLAAGPKAGPPSGLPCELHSGLHSGLHCGLHCGVLEDGAVLDLLLDRPKGNVLDGALMTALADALTAHRGDRGLKVVILRGAGGHFSFGASVEEHQSATVAAMLGRFHALCRLVAAYPVPILAAVEGRCLGGAFELVLCGHVVLAKAGARFGCPEVRLGVFPPVLAVAGPLRLGAARSERLVLTGATMGAEEALQCGLAAAAVAPEADLLDAALAWYREHLAPTSAFALRQAVVAARRGSGLLTALDAGLDAAERQYLDAVVPSHDGNEGIAAFLQKRAPRWTHA